MISPLPVSPDPAPIPKILHLIWVGSPVPDWVQDRWDAWRDNCPDWTINFWDDASAAWWPRSARLASLCSHPAILADLIRLEVVSTFGGVYLDSDTWPLRSLDPLTGDQQAWVSSLHDGSDNYQIVLNNGAFGAPAGHPFLAEVWSEATRRLQQKGRYSRLHFYAGPPVWTWAWMRSAGMRIMPREAFNPLNWDHRYKKIPMAVEDLVATAEAHPDSYALHEFEQSWNVRVKQMHPEVHSG